MASVTNEEVTDVHKYPYKWKLGGTVFALNKGKVFSCFSCGGGVQWAIN